MTEAQGDTAKLKKGTLLYAVLLYDERVSKFLHMDYTDTLNILDSTGMTYVGNQV